MLIVESLESVIQTKEVKREKTVNRTIINRVF